MSTTKNSRDSQNRLKKKEACYLTQAAGGLLQYLTFTVKAKDLFMEIIRGVSKFDFTQND